MEDRLVGWRQERLDRRPHSAGQLGTAEIDFNKIVDGSLDDTIRARAQGAKALGKPFFLDFAAEMNGDEAWSGNNPPLYVAAYRHIHDVFVTEGATNVVWAWCPNVTDVEGGNSRTMDYYPGDTYVDWTGVDGYNWGKGNGGWQSFEEVFARIYPLLAAKGKPILIGEMASAEVGGNKAEWIDAIIATLRTKYPMVKGLVWFDVNKERDWRINSSPATLEAFARAPGTRTSIPDAPIQSRSSADADSIPAAMRQAG